MAILKCKMCGGQLEIVAGESVVTCEYCGTQQTVPTADDEKKLIQFDRAEKLRKQCEFDKAAGIYETIVADFREEAEAYWGLVLCKYGIEYVDDPATGKKIPTCHRSSFDSVLDDANFEQTLENADELARKVYRGEAKAIEELRKGIVSVSAKEEPYDIFICYKETDSKGERTVDSVMAQDVYDALTDKGYRVFFARISLEDKLGQEYEPYIFAALNSAKVMLAFGTDYEYFNAVWVKNEWARFLELMAKDKSKHLIPCYKGIDAYDMPKEFAPLQAQDLGKVGATQDLLRGVEKLLPKKQSIKETVVVQQGATNATEPLLKRAFMSLEDGEWEKADALCEQVLNLDPECDEAYLGKLMADLQVKKQEDLKNCEEPFDNNGNYQKVLRFANDSLKATLTGYVKAIKTKLEEERLEKERKAEIARKEAEEREKRTKKLLFVLIPLVLFIALFASFMANFVKPRIERNNKYNEAVKAIDEGRLIEAYEAFISLGDYKDSAGKAASIYDSAEYKTEKIKAAKVGDYIFFGSYEQDNILENGVEDIEWLVLEKKDNSILIISKKTLALQHYNEKHENITWETCSLRTWLNESFYNSAFTQKDQAIILDSLVTADNNPNYSYDAGRTFPVPIELGNDTNDKVFVLSILEAKQYFKTKNERKCDYTLYATSGRSDQSSEWWLRTPGWDNNNAAFVRDDGTVNHAGRNIGTYHNADGSLFSYGTSGVRPAMWIDLSKVK